MPYYTLSQLENQLDDDRKWINGDRLRKFVSLPVRRKERRGPSTSDRAHQDIVYEAQTTIGIAGIDETRWTAIGLVDNTLRSQSITRYEAETRLEGISGEDPIAGKVLTANYQIFGPRLYFLWTWEARASQISKEWDAILSNVEQTVNE